MKKKDDNLHINAGPGCNNNCIFCNESNREERDKYNLKYTPAVIEKILKKHSQKVNKVIFTSGEPTLNSELFDLIKKAKDLGYNNLSLTTNGRMLSYEKFAEKLLESGLNEVIISIHGHSSKLHDGLTRTKGSFEQTVNGIENMSLLTSKYNFKLLLATTVNKLNFSYFAEMVNFYYNYNFFELVFNVVQPIQSNMSKYFFKVMPQYSAVSKEIENLFINQRELFFRGKGDDSRRIISIIDLPFCQSKILADYLGFGENRIIEEIDKKHSAESKFKTKKFIDNRGVKFKREECTLCRYNYKCNGIYRNYIENYGWDEFIPIPYNE